MNRNLEILRKFIDTQNQRIQDDVSKQGYKDNSPYRNNPFNVIQGTSQGTPITMKGVSTPLMGIDELGNKQYMQPGQEYYYPGSSVKEIPIAQVGGIPKFNINDYSKKKNFNPKKQVIPEVLRESTKVAFRDEKGKQREVNPNKPVNFEGSQEAFDDFRKREDIGYAAAALSPLIVDALPVVASMVAPYVETAMATQLPGLASVPGATVGNALTSYFATHGLMNAAPDAKELIKNPSWGNAGSLGMDALEIAPMAGPAVKTIGEGLSTAGKALGTEEGLLSNAYKYNPWAFKPNESNWYRQVGKSAVDDAFNTGLVREAREEVSPRMWEEFQDQIKRLQGDDASSHLERMKQQMLAGRRPVSPFFNKGELFYPMGRKPIINKTTGKLSKNPAGAGSADYLIETSLPNESFQPAYVKGMYLGVPEEIGSTAILKPNPELRNLENFNIYKKDWLRGYKPIEVPTQLTGSSNVASVVNTARNLEDLKAAQQFAKQYGYELPSDLKRIAQSDILTDRTIRGMMDRHNTFVRGVSTNWEHLAEKNPEILKHLQQQGFDITTEEGSKAAAEYMSTHIPINTGYGRFGLKEGENALYLSNSVPTAEGYTYGNGYIVKVKRPTDFSSANRQDWLTANDFDAHLGFKGSPFGQGIVKNDYIKRFPTNFRETLAITGDPNKMTELQAAVEEKKVLYDELAHQSWKNYNNKISDLKYKTNADYRRSIISDDPIIRDSPNFFDKLHLKYLQNKKNLTQTYYDLLPLKDIAKGVYGDADVWKAFSKNLFGKLDPFSHYAIKGEEGEKVLETLKSIKVNPEGWQNTSRAHINKYTNKLTRRENGGNVQLEQKKQGGVIKQKKALNWLYS